MIKALILYLVVLSVGFVSLAHEGLAWLLNVAVLFVLPVGSVVLWRHEGRALRDLGLRLGDSWRRALVLGLLVGCVVPTACIALQWILGWITVQRNVWIDSPGSLLVTTAGFMLLVAFVEELAYRGFYLQCFCLRARFGAALVLSSLLFSLNHLPAMFHARLPLIFFPITLLNLFILGTTFGLGFYRTRRSLWFPVSLHFAYDMVYTNPLYFMNRTGVRQGLLTDLSPTWLFGDIRWLPESGTMGFFLGVTLLILVWAVTRPRSAASHGA